MPEWPLLEKSKHPEIQRISEFTPKRSLRIIKSLFFAFISYFLLEYICHKEQQNRRLTTELNG